MMSLSGLSEMYWAFWQRYSEVRAWQQGQEYTWPALPQELEEVSPTDWSSG